MNREDLLELLNLKFLSAGCINKGFILDLPLETEDGDFWLNALKTSKLTIQKFRNRPFTHIVELENSDNSVQYQRDSIYESPENFKIFSDFDRVLLKRPKAKKEGEEEINEDDENFQKPVEVDQLVKRPNECIPFDQERYQKIHEYIQFCLPGLKPQEFISVERSIGMAPEDLVACVQTKLFNK